VRKPLGRLERWRTWIAWRRGELTELVRRCPDLVRPVYRRPVWSRAEAADSRALLCLPAKVLSTISCRHGHDEAVSSHRLWLGCPARRRPGFVHRTAALCPQPSDRPPRPLTCSGQ